jgi:ABC-type lipoprotein export system ATPase subunit
VTAIEARGLRKGVRLPSGDHLTLLESVDLDIAAGRSVAVVGRSGSGKSTLLTVLGLLLPPDGGSLRVAGHDVGALNDRQRSLLRNRHIGFVFQNYSLLGHLTAAENVALPLLMGDRVAPAQARRRVAEAMDAVDIGHRASSRPVHLSGGEQQRVAIARALVRSPAVILADEPTGALDADTSRQVLAAFAAAVERRGTALVLVTHDDEVAGHADRVLHLDQGRLRDRERACA